MRSIAVGLVIVACAGADWKSRAFPDWPESTVYKLLTDSPWTRPKRVELTWHKREPDKITYKDIPGANHGVGNPQYGPLGGIGAPKPKLDQKADILIRFSNALPVRHATALFQFREAKGKGTINSFIPAPEDAYVVEIFGVPTEMGHGGTGLVDSIVQRSAYLHTRTGRTLKPERVTTQIRESGLSVRVHFSRREPIQLADDDVEFFADLQVFSVKERFRLASMVYQGNLEL